MCSKLCGLYDLLPNRVSPLAAFICLSDRCWTIFWDMYVGKFKQIHAEFNLKNLSELAPTLIPEEVIFEYLSKVLPPDCITLDVRLFFVIPAN